MVFQLNYICIKVLHLMSISGSRESFGDTCSEQWVIMNKVVVVGGNKQNMGLYSRFTHANQPCWMKSNLAPNNTLDKSEIYKKYFPAHSLFTVLHL